MASSSRYIINGFSFEVVFNMKPVCRDGIVIPEETDLSNRKVINALKILQSQMKYIRAHHYLGEYQTQYGDHDDEAREMALLALSTPSDMPQMNAYERQVAELIVSGKWYPQQRESKPAYQPKPGFVYLLKSSEGYYKIGRTKDPKNRMKTFGIQLPMHVEYVCLIETEDMTELETMLHIEYKSKRIAGEWFDLNEDDIEYIKGLA